MQIYIFVENYFTCYKYYSGWIFYIFLRTTLAFLYALLNFHANA